jgi:hypothetical protein
MHQTLAIFMRRLDYFFLDLNVMVSLLAQVPAMSAVVPDVFRMYNDV